MVARPNYVYSNKKAAQNSNLYVYSNSIKLYVVFHLIPNKYPITLKNLFGLIGTDVQMQSKCKLIEQTRTITYILSLSSLLFKAVFQQIFSQNWVKVLFLQTGLFRVFVELFRKFHNKYRKSITTNILCQLYCTGAGVPKVIGIGNDAVYSRLFTHLPRLLTVRTGHMGGTGILCWYLVYSRLLTNLPRLLTARTGHMGGTGILCWYLVFFECGIISTTMLFLLFPLRQEQDRDRNIY